ncbi:MAG: potassium channel family protein [Coriobacteriia bacterium]
MPDKKIATRIEDEAEELAVSGWRLANEDRYVLVFALIIVTILLNALPAQNAVGTFLFGMSLTLTLIVTLVTSNSKRRTIVVAGGLVVLLFAATVVTQMLGMAMISRICFQVAAVAACLIVPFVIGRRIALHPRVTLNTVAGAADIYLLFGLLFAVVYSLVGDVVLLWYPSLVANIGPTTTAAQAFFIAGRPPLPSDFMYYSFVTLTTVGYGDLTASTAIGRMLSVTEALVGQLYLVTVVAILVSNMGRSRNPAGA